MFAHTVIDNVEKVIVGKRAAIEMLMVALLCEGHVLIEDVPGVGKTMLARQVALMTAAGISPFTKNRMEPIRTTFIDLENPERMIVEI